MLEDIVLEVLIVVCRYMNSLVIQDLDKYEDGDFVVYYVEEYSLDKYREFVLQLVIMNV